MTGQLNKDLLGDTSGHDAGVMDVVGQAVKSAALNRLTWASVALAVVLVLSWGLGGFMIIPATFALTFAASLVTNGRRYALRRAKSERPISLPDPGAFCDPAAQSMVRRLIQAREGLERALEESPRGEGFDLAAVERGTPALERRILVLSARAEYLGAFLTTVSVPEIELALDRARGRERGASSPGARRTYQRLVQRHQEHLETVRALEAERDELLATIDYLVSTIEALPATMTRIQLLRVSYAEGESGIDSMDDANRLVESLGAFEQAFSGEEPTQPHAAVASA